MWNARKEGRRNSSKMHRYTHSNISAPSEVWNSRFRGVDNSLHRGFTLSASVNARDENNNGPGSSNHRQVHLHVHSVNWTVAAWWDTMKD